MIKINIYQINMESEHRNLAFMGYELWDKQGVFPHAAMYESIYEMKVDGENIKKNAMTICNQLFRTFNSDEKYPNDYRGHSISVSDVIVMEDSGSRRAYFCDNIGWKDVTTQFFA